MEKIRKALDLALEERGRLASADPAPLPRGPAPAVTDPHFAPRAERAVARLGYQYTRTPVHVPDAAALEAGLVIAPTATSSAAEAFRMLRTQVLQRMREHGWRSLGVVGVADHDGATTAAVNLAAAIAADPGRSALLCELDLRAPRIAGMFGWQAPLGVDDVLSGGAQIEQCLFHPAGFERLVVLPARAPLAGSSAQLAGPAARELAAELAARYPDRIVVYDLPPVLAADDALAFSPLVDCLLVVVCEGRTRRSDLVRCLEILRARPLVGTVLNRAAAAGTSAA